MKDFPSDFKIPKNAQAIVVDRRSYKGGVREGEVLAAIRDDRNRNLKDVCQQLVDNAANYFKWEDYTIMAAFVKDFKFDERLSQIGCEIRD